MPTRSDRPEAKKGGRVRRALRNLLWRQPSKPDQQLLERVGKLRQERSEQPGPYFAIDTGPLLIVGIDTGIRGKLDREQGDWLRRISKVPKPKLLLTGKPLVVDAHTKETEIEGGGGVRAIVDDPAHRYIAVIGGDIHNYQRYPVKMPDGRTIQHIVSGAAGAYTKATHKIPKVKPEACGCSEDDFRCYPRRGDSLAAYSRLYDRKFGLGRGYLVVPYQQAPAIMSQLLEGKIEPTRTDGRRAGDHAAGLEGGEADHALPRLDRQRGRRHAAPQLLGAARLERPAAAALQELPPHRREARRARAAVLRRDRLRRARGRSAARGLDPRPRAARRDVGVGGVA